MSRVFKILDDLVCASRVCSTSASDQQDNIVKDMPNISTRLMNGTNNSSSAGRDLLECKNDGLGYDSEPKVHTA
jgi:hypothetical protein